MNSLLYVLRTGYKNWLKKNLKRPGFYFYVIFLVAYVFFLLSALYGWVVTGGHREPEIFVMALTAILLYFTPMNYRAYANRKGLSFLPSHVHLMFSAPISPKKLLIFGSLQTFSVSMILELIVIVIGIFFFQFSLLQMLLYFLLVSCFSFAVEFALIICLYGNERFSTKVMEWIAKIFWFVLLAMVAVAAVFFLKNGFTFQNVLSFLVSDWICYIPIFGWQVALIRLLLLGAGTAELIGSICYLIYGAVLIFCAVRLRCTGAYYEDAIKFADDFQKIMDRRKKGDATTAGEKKLRKHASVTYKGSGARAIFYRQLLEYKKSRFYMFGISTLIYAGVGIGFLVLQRMGKVQISGTAAYYAVFGILVYLFLVFGQMQTKWDRELENPYVFMIPSSSFSKLFYATALEHVKTICEVLLLVLPYGIALKLPAWYLVLVVLVAVIAKAVKLYADTVTTLFLGNHFGTTARQMLRMLIESILLGIAFLIGLVCHMIAGPFPAVVAAGIYLTVAAVALMIAGAGAFARMEYQAG
ncbi:MAG: putative ABC exporter domain-containing protein [Lachnospiraceae bacterium]|nr:putative ABC exporter domain-containing protein [Lachnospiraceae bacterium]